MSMGNQVLNHTCQYTDSPQNLSTHISGVMTVPAACGAPETDVELHQVLSLQLVELHEVLRNSYGGSGSA